MDSLEVGETCNQTLLENYDSYWHEYKQIIDIYFKKYREEFIDYFLQNAQHLGLAIIVYTIFTLCFYVFIMQTKIIHKVGTINCKSILFVTSHPDDECMFFGPSIVTFCDRSDVMVYLLCLSKGNFRGEGAIRKEELFESCKILGIPEAHIQVVNSTALPDDPNVNWNQEIVAQIILNFIETYSIDTVISFDQYGVSNHKNHKSIFYAMAYLCLERKLPKKCKAYALESVSKIRKYASYLDLPLTFLMSSKKLVVSKDKCDLIRKAMRAHKSQYVWFRKFYMFLSRYVFVNSFKQIDILELELEFEMDDV